MKKTNVSLADDQINIKDLSIVLNISTQRIGQLVKLGIIPPAVSRGRYQFLKSIHGYLIFLQARAKSGDKKDFLAEKTRLTSAQATLAELKVCEEKGILINKEAILRMLDRMILTFRSKVLYRSARVAPLLFGCQSIAELHEELQKSDHECLDELANTHPSTYVELDESSR
jgi:phage terminase Nu1 subunit (DNA packaging protein)